MVSTGRSRRMEGWLGGCLAATAVIDVVAFFFVILAEFRHTGALSPSIIFVILISVLVTFVMVCLLSAIPAAVVIWLGKKFQVRSVWLFGVAGALIGGLSQIVFFDVLLSRSPSPSPFVLLTETIPLFVLAGLMAGVVYWCVAERR